MYVGPWQEYQLAKVRKDATRAVRAHLRALAAREGEPGDITACVGTAAAAFERVRGALTFMQLVDSPTRFRLIDPIVRALPTLDSGRGRVDSARTPTSARSGRRALGSHRGSGSGSLGGRSVASAPESRQPPARHDRSKARRPAPQSKRLPPARGAWGGAGGDGRVSPRAVLARAAVQRSRHNGADVAEHSGPPKAPHWPSSVSTPTRQRVAPRRSSAASPGAASAGGHSNAFRLAPIPLSSVGGTEHDDEHGNNTITLDAGTLAQLLGAMGDVTASASGGAAGPKRARKTKAEKQRLRQAKEDAEKEAVREARAEHMAKLKRTYIMDGGGADESAGAAGDAPDDPARAAGVSAESGAARELLLSELAEQAERQRAITEQMQAAAAQAYAQQQAAAAWQHQLAWQAHYAAQQQQYGGAAGVTAAGAATATADYAAPGAHAAPPAGGAPAATGSWHGQHEWQSWQHQQAQAQQLYAVQSRPAEAAVDPETRKVLDVFGVQPAAPPAPTSPSREVLPPLPEVESRSSTAHVERVKDADSGLQLPALRSATRTAHSPVALGSRTDTRTKDAAPELAAYHAEMRALRESRSGAGDGSAQPLTPSRLPSFEPLAVDGPAGRGTPPAGVAAGNAPPSPGLRASMHESRSALRTAGGASIASEVSAGEAEVDALLGWAGSLRGEAMLAAMKEV